MVNSPYSLRAPQSIALANHVDECPDVVDKVVSINNFIDSDIYQPAVFSQSQCDEAIDVLGKVFNDKCTIDISQEAFEQQCEEVTEDVALLNEFFGSYHQHSLPLEVEVSNIDHIQSSEPNVSLSVNDSAVCPTMTTSHEKAKVPKISTVALLKQQNGIITASEVEPSKTSRSLPHSLQGIEPTRVKRRDAKDSLYVCAYNFFHCECCTELNTNLDGFLVTAPQLDGTRKVEFHGQQSSCVK